MRYYFYLVKKPKSHIEIPRLSFLTPAKFRKSLTSEEMVEFCCPINFKQRLPQAHGKSQGKTLGEAIRLAWEYDGGNDEPVLQQLASASFLLGWESRGRFEKERKHKKRKAA